MKITIDRIEEYHAVVELETREFVNLPIVLVPSGAKEGDVLQIEINRSATEDRRKQVKDLMNKVFED